MKVVDEMMAPWRARYQDNATTSYKLRFVEAFVPFLEATNRVSDDVEGIAEASGSESGVMLGEVSRPAAEWFVQDAAALIAPVKGGVGSGMPSESVTIAATVPTGHWAGENTLSCGGRCRRMWGLVDAVLERGKWGCINCMIDHARGACAIYKPCLYACKVDQ